PARARAVPGALSHAQHGRRSALDGRPWGAPTGAWHPQHGRTGDARAPGRCVRRLHRLRGTGIAPWLRKALARTRRVRSGGQPETDAHGKGDKVGYPPLQVTAQRLMAAYLYDAGYADDLKGPLLRPVKNNRTKMQYNGDDRKRLHLALGA